MTTMTDDRSRAVDLAIGQIEKQFGRGAIMRMGDQKNLEIEAIPTGALSLDLALGIGGVPRGRITELFGPESSGKSTLCQHIIAEAQRLGGLAAYIDVEHALDPAFARAIGVNIDDLLISQPDTGEQALEIAEALVRSNAVDIVVVDSVAALVPRAEIEGDMGDSLPGLQARLMSQALRKLTGTISKTRTAVIFVNQLREKIGVVFGNPETTPGGRALKFYSSVRIDIRRIESLKIGQQVVGNRVRTRVVKNKVAAPFRQAEFDLLFTGKTTGISREGDILDLGVEFEILKKLGAFYSYGEQRLGQGREKARDFLIENPDLASRIELEIRDAAKAATQSPSARPRVAVVEADDEDEEEPEDE
jgi:recombination protein RecA